MIQPDETVIDKTGVNQKNEKTKKKKKKILFLLPIDIFCNLWYKIVMLNSINIPKTYTPGQVASILQLTKNTIYDLIDRGEIVAKKIGKVYRIPVTSVYFALTGMDYDLYLAEKEDFKNLNQVEKSIKEIRKRL